MDSKQPEIYESFGLDQNLNHNQAQHVKHEQLSQRQPFQFKTTQNVMKNNNYYIPLHQKNFQILQNMPLESDKRQTAIESTNQSQWNKQFQNNKGHFLQEKPISFKNINISQSNIGNTGNSTNSFVRTPFNNQRHVIYRPIINSGPSSSILQPPNQHPTIISHQNQGIKPSQRVVFGPTIIPSNGQINFKKQEMPITHSSSFKSQPIRKVVLPGDFTSQTDLKNQIFRWQNRFQDLQSKYNDLKALLNRNQTSKIEEVWILEEQNRLLKEKIKVMEQKEKKYSAETQMKLARLIQYHRDATVKQCQLLIDRYRLETKLASKK